MATIGRTIKIMREGIGMTQTQFAAKADISFNTLSKLERDHAVSTKTIARCANALGVSIEKLREEALKIDFVKQAQQKGEASGWEKVWTQKSLS